MDLNEYNELRDEMNREYEYNEEDYDDNYDYDNELTPLDVIRKYIPVIFLIALVFIFYKIGILKKILYIANIFLIGIIVYSVISIVVFKNSIREVKDNLISMFNKIKTLLTKASGSYVETSQHLFDKYISDDDRARQSEYNSFKGVGSNPYERIKEDLDMNEYNNSEDPGYIGSSAGYINYNEGNDIFDTQKDIEQAEMVRKEGNKYIIANPKYKKSDNYEFENEEMGVKRVINDRGDIKTYRIINNTLIKDNTIDDAPYYEFSRILDPTITPRMNAEQVKIINNGGMLEMYLSNCNILGSENIVKLIIEYAGTIYRVNINNLQEMKLDGQMILTIDN